MLRAWLRNCAPRRARAELRAQVLALPRDPTLEAERAPPPTDVAVVVARQQHTDLCFSADGRYVLHGTYGGLVDIYDVTAPGLSTPVATLEQQHACVSALRFSPTSCLIASGAGKSLALFIPR